MRASEDTVHVWSATQTYKTPRGAHVAAKNSSTEKAEGQCTVKRLMREAGINSTNVSCRTVQRFLRSKGYKYLHARQKGLLTEQDIVKRLKLAREFSNSLIMHKEKTKEITTVTVVWIPDLN